VPCRTVDVGSSARVIGNIGDSRQASLHIYSTAYLPINLLSASFRLKSPYQDVFVPVLGGGR